ncbi:MAG: hypothetical protein QM638_04485 [Nocardioides sp.]|uniref:hypothetical protein n=1 Tax=Nocardioides sp. TaxID=35761 RepID=UPI0039E58DFD
MLDSLRFAWWVTAWLRGDASTDDVLDGVIGADATHVVLGLPELGLGGEPGVAQSLVGGLGRLRVEGGTGAGLAVPAYGDPVGLGGPPEFNTAALEAGQAVVTDAGLGLVPIRVGAVIEWHCLPAWRRAVPDVGEADRGLRAALRDSATALAELDVARWRPEAADRLINLRHAPALPQVPGIPPRCVELAARGSQAAEIVEVALEDDGAAISAGEIERRRQALVPLDRAVRRALSAAGSPEAWPPG